MKPRVSKTYPSGKGQAKGRKAGSSHSRESSHCPGKYKQILGGRDTGFRWTCGLDKHPGPALWGFWLSQHSHVYKFYTDVANSTHSCQRKPHWKTDRNSTFVQKTFPVPLAPRQSMEAELINSDMLEQNFPRNKPKATTSLQLPRNSCVPASALLMAMVCSCSRFLSLKH